MGFGRRDFLRLGCYSVAAFAVLGAGSFVRAETPVRPPGAIAEPDFLSLCLRCGRCVDTCPQKALTRGTLGTGGLVGIGTPILQGGCTVCLECVAECPSGALAQITEAEARMGRVHVNPEHCIGCWLCVRECPREGLIRNDQTRVPDVDLNNCIGCGLCVPVCPAEVTALTLSPEGASRPPLRG